MNRDHLNDEQMDSLMRQVFGESEAGDLATLGGVSAEAMEQEKLVLNNLRSELRGLKDVPECQLSTEHLRNAILNQGSGSPTKRTAPWASLWKFGLPVAACAAIGAWVMFGPKPLTQDVGTAGGTQIALNTEAPKGTLVNPVPTQEIEKEVVPIQTEPSKPVTDGVETHGMSKKPFRRPRSNVGPLAARTESPAIGLEALTGVATASLDSAPRGATNTSKMMPAASDMVSDSASRAMDSLSTDDREDSGKVVIVGGGSQVDSRASSATEVDKRDVVFGG